MTQFQAGLKTTTALRTYVLEAVIIAATTAAAAAEDRGEDEAVGFAIVKVASRQMDEGSGGGGAGGTEEMENELGVSVAWRREREGEGDDGGDGGNDAHGTAQAWEVNGGEVLNEEFCDVYLTRRKVYERLMSDRRHGCRSSSHSNPSLSLPCSVSASSELLKITPIYLYLSDLVTQVMLTTDNVCSQKDWTTLMVHPVWQRRGIGSAMIQWAMEHIRLEMMPIWPFAQPDGSALYLRHGWRDVEDIDIDLSKWTVLAKPIGRIELCAC